MNPDQFFEGLTRVRLEDLRHKYGIPRDIKPELLAAILAFMEADDASRCNTTERVYRRHSAPHTNNTASLFH